MITWIRFSLLIFSCCAFSAEGQNGWAHLELGAGNYGADGHTKTSQVKTVLMKVKEVSAKENYIDNLQESGQGNYKPEEQYKLLFWTLDELVKRYGDVGTFHVNDLYEEYANFATDRLKEYASSKGYHSVVIEAVPGDYQFLSARELLFPYGKTLYSSIHLKNPEVSFYHDRIDGDLFSSSDRSRYETRRVLDHLASLSENGLYLFIIDHEYFIPAEEKVEFMEKGIVYHETRDWEPVVYVFPEGTILEKPGRVFHISGLF